MTRSSTVAEWERRSILSFNTSSISPTSTISSAVLTLTVKSGLGSSGQTRPVTVYRLASSFVEKQATWKNRQTGVAWATAGGDRAEVLTTVYVSNVAGTKVNIDVTSLVQRTVKGDYGTTEARLVMVDVGGGGDAKESYREYHASEATTTTNRPQLRVTFGTTSPSTPPAIDVPPGGDLQKAMSQAQPGGTIRLAAGAVYVGNFTIPARVTSSYVTVTTAGVTLPPAGTRISPSLRGQLATIRSPNVMSALKTSPAASYYRFVGVAFEANASGDGDIIALGNHAYTSTADVPHHLEFDRVLIRGDSSVGQKRGISANATDVLIQNSDIRDIKAAGQDSQAIALWNTPGRITIRNNYLEASGENIMVGGAHINIANLVPADIVIEGNTFKKNPLWRSQSWTVKNLLELKSGRRVAIRNNLFEYNWQGGQAGYAIVFTPRNSSKLTPWVVVEDVEFSSNTVRHSGGAFNLLGRDDTAYSGQLARVAIRNNLVWDISTTYGSGTFAQIGGEPRDITIDHNTILHSGNAVTFYLGAYIGSNGARVVAGPTRGFAFTNNLLKHNAYGIFGSGQAYGTGSLNYYAPGAIVKRNVLAGGTASRYPADNLFPTVTVFNASFVNIGAADYRLVAASTFIDAGTDGKDIGCTLPGWQ